MTYRDSAAPGSYYNASRPHPINPDNWDGLPFDVRQRWWRETNFDRRPPSDELLAIIMALIRQK